MSSFPSSFDLNDCREVLALLAPFAKSSEAFTDAGAGQRIESLVKRLLELFSRGDFKIPAELEAEFVSHNHVISNLVALSSLKTTDAALQVIGSQPDNLSRVLTLFSARNAAGLIGEDFLRRTRRLRRFGMCSLRSFFMRAWFQR